MSDAAGLAAAAAPGISGSSSGSAGAAAAAAGAHVSARFVEAFIKSIGVIGSSEIGDKTFFIAAIMAMRHPRVTVFGGALAALAVMTVLAVALGWAAPALLPKSWTHYAATALFFFFGGKTLWDAAHHEEGESELEAVEQELADARATGSRDRLVLYTTPGKDAELGSGGGGGGGAAAAKARLHGMAARGASALSVLVSPVFLNAFVLTFLAEWGDRSQIATIGLAASMDVVGVTVGSIVGHAACTAAAVIGGKHLAAHINERTVGYVGGVMFLLFGLHSLYVGPE